MYNWKKRLLAAVLAGCMTVGLMAPALATVGGEDTASTAVDTGFSVDPVYPVEPTDPVEPVEPTPPVETEIPDGEIPLDPGFGMHDWANMSTEELYEVVKDLSDEDRAIVYSLLTEEQIAALEEYEKAMENVALEAAYPAIDPVTVSGEDGVSVTVSAPVGAFPVGTELTIEPVVAPNPLLDTLNLEEDQMAVVEAAVAEALSEAPEEPRQTVAFDITFWLDGQEIQPVEGYTVNVSFSVANDSALLSDADQLQVFHLEENADADPVAQPVGDPVEIDASAETQEVSVEAEQFSVYALSAAARAQYPVTVVVGEKKELQGEGKVPILGEERWQVVDGSIINLESQNGNKATIRGLNPGKTTVKYQVKEFLGSWKDRTTFVVEVVPASPLSIQDNILESGCFLPKLAESAMPTDGVVTYQWTHSTEKEGTYSSVKPEAVLPEYAVADGVNVAVDDGARMWYKVAAYNSANELIAESEPKQVPYYDEIHSDTAGFQTYKGSRFAQIPEDYYEELQWKTTANDGRIEIADGPTAGAAFGVWDGAADGLQFAELNCTQYGTLYQDVLTAPGAELYWSLNHRGRSGTDTMYVVIMSTQKAQEMNIQSQEQIEAIIENPEQYQASVYKVESETGAWKTHSGTYQTVNGQYLTRFFFAAYSAAGGGADGNLLDAVSFSDQMPYTIEYYVDGEKKETDNGNADPYTTVAADLTGYEGYALDHTTLNGADYSGSTSMFMGPGKEHVLRLYFVSTGITVTKEITGLADGLTEDELSELLGNYQAKFELWDADQKVASATVKVEPTSQSGSALFMSAENPDEKFVPSTNKTYTVKEISYGTIAGYRFESGNVDQQLLIGQVPVGKVTFVNHYKELPKSGDLTIEKNVTGGETPEQSFIFKVTDGSNFETMVVMNPTDFENGHCVVVLKELPAGTYTVTEQTNWSWKYNQTEVTPSDGSVMVSSDNPEAKVTFANTRNEKNWLGGSDSVENHFAPVNSGSSDQTIDTLDALVPPLPTGEKKQENEDDQKKTEPDPGEDPDLDGMTQEGGVDHV